MPTARKVSYVVFGLLFAAVVWLHLGALVLSGLFSFMILDITHKRLMRRIHGRVERWLSLVVFLISAVLIFWAFGHFIRQSLSTLPAIASTAIPKLAAAAEPYGIELPFDGSEDFREMVVRAIRENVQFLRRASGLLTKRFFHIIIGSFAACLLFLAPEAPTSGGTLYHGLRREMVERFQTFMLGFEKVFGAQITISAINTVFTGIYLLALGFPFIPFLILATFILGCIPLLGGIASNTIIVGTALTISPKLAVFSLIFLVVIHKLEYFLNSRIMGVSVGAPMWLMLLAIVTGDAVMGVAGIILAPALLHYVREELKQIQAEGA